MYSYHMPLKMLQRQGQLFLQKCLPLPQCSLRYQVTTASSDYVSKDNVAKPFSEIPGPKGLYNVPYLGTLLHFKPFTNYTIQELPQLLKCMREKYGDIHTMKLGKATAVFIHHPDYFKSLLQQPYKMFIRPSLDIFEIYHQRNIDAPRTLPTLKGEEWAALRKPAQEKMLRPAVVNTYASLIGNVTNDFIEKLRRKGRTDDLLSDLLNYTTESVCMLCFNRRFGCLDDGPPAEIIQHVSTFFSTLHESMYMPIKTFKYFRTKMYNEFENARLSVSRIVKTEYQRQVEILNQLEKDGKLQEYLEKEPNFMYSLITDPRVSDESVYSIALSLIFAGIDSTANSLVFILADLALHPDKQEAAYREVHDIVGDSPNLTKEHLAQLSYVKACVKESHRRTFPLILGNGRVTEFDVVVGGYQIPPWVGVFTVMSNCCKDERFFPRPEEFLPERWLRSTDENMETITKAQDFPFAMQPFGHGPRGCLGQRFAELEMHVALTKILQNFTVKLPDGVTHVESFYRVFASPKEEVEMHFLPRKQS